MMKKTPIYPPLLLLLLVVSASGCMKCCEEPLPDGTCCCITAGCPVTPLPPSCPPPPHSRLLAADRLPTEECDVTRFGARGDNRTEATSAFRAAIEACAGKVGGAVVVPPGTYLLRPVELVSHTALVIQPGATLLAWPGVGWQAGWPNSTSETCTASPYEAKAPVVLPQLESLLYADGVVNVSVSGGGRLDGQGWRWWPQRDKSEYGHHCRPHLIRIDCGNSTRTSTGISIDNLALHNSPHFNIHAYDAEIPP